MIQSVHAFILGTVQGLTAFLPVSSWSHLIVFPWLLKWDDAFLNSLTFQVALQLGSVIALLVFFRREWLALARDLFRGIREKRVYDSFNRRLVWFIAVATVPGALFGYLFERQIKESLRNPLTVGAAMIVFGIVLYLADRRARSNTRGYEQITLRDSIAVGMAQAVALVPGVSRSGITMTAALFLGLDRETSAHFSFLLAMPILLGAALLKTHRLIHHFPRPDIGPFVWGLVGSTLISYIVIDALLLYLKRHSFVPFVWYRTIFGAFLILMYYGRMG